MMFPAFLFGIVLGFVLMANKIPFEPHKWKIQLFGAVFGLFVGVWARVILRKTYSDFRLALIPVPVSVPDVPLVQPEAPENLKCNTLRSQAFQYQNIYAYVGGNPISFVDPMGLEGVTSALAGMPQQASVFDRRPDFVTFQFAWYVGGVSGSFDRFGNAYIQFSVSRPYPVPSFSGVGAAVAAGWAKGCDPSEDDLKSLLGGGSMGFTGGFAGVGGGIDYSPSLNGAGGLGVVIGVGIGGFAMSGGYGGLTGSYGGGW